MTKRSTPSDDQPGGFFRAPKRSKIRARFLVCYDPTGRGSGLSEAEQASLMT